MRRLLLLIFITTIGALLVQGCASDQESAAPQYSEEEIAARVDDWVVTRETVQQAINQMPDYKQTEYNTDAGRAEVTRLLIQEQLFYREAERHGLAEKSWVRKQIEDANRRILISAYYKEFVETEARPTEEEMHDFYEDHQDRYMMLAVARGQHVFSKNREKLDDIKERVLEGGEKFTTMAHNYSEDDLTRADGGDLGYFNPGGYVRGFGYNTAIADSMFQMEIGRIYGPMKWSKGYSLIRINERRDAELKPYADVRDEIEKALTQERIEDARARISEDISKNYRVENLHEQYYRTVQRSPEELFNVAQATDDPNVKIRAYREIVEKFPNDDFAPKAMFMVGFVYAEELQDRLQADRAFTEVVAKFPDTDMADQAQWMLENMYKGTPNFDEIEKKINED